MSEDLPLETRMRHRPSARLLVIDSASRILLFRFTHKTGPLAGQEYWATPGGGLKQDESYAEAAVRELSEETGIQMNLPKDHVAKRRFVMQLPDGEHVVADERYYVVRTADAHIQKDRWTASEKQLMSAHKWWKLEELETTSDIVFPEELTDFLCAAISTGDGNMTVSHSQP